MSDSEAVKRFKEPKSILLGFLIGSSVAVLVWFVCVQILGGSSSSEAKTSTQEIDGASPATGSIARELEQLEDFERSFSGTASLYNAISIKDEIDLLDWLDESVELQSLADRHAVQSVIFERFSELNPDDALQHALKIPREDQSRAIESVFGVWSVSDLDSAIEAGSNLEPFLKHKALIAILKTRSDLREDLQLKIATQFDGARFVPQLMAERIAREMGGNPERAWNAIVKNEQSLVSRAGLLADLAGDWRQQNSERLIEKIVESINPGVDAWSSEKYVFLRYVVKVLARVNPQEIFDQASSLSHSCRDALMHAIAEEWAQSDPVSAFSTVSNYEQNTGYKNLTSTVASVWARSDLQALIANMESYSADLKLAGLEQAVIAIARSIPQEAISLMDELANQGLKISVIQSSFVKEWSMQDPQSATKWVQSRQESFGPGALDMLHIALVNLAPLEPELAMDIALRNLSEEEGRALDLEVVLSLVGTDLESAEALLPRVSKESKLSAVIWLACHLTANGRPQRALQLGDHLHESEKTNLFYSVFPTWAANNPLQMMNALDELATPAIRKIAATQLVQRQQSHPLLSHDQLKYVKSFLNGD